MAKVTGYKCDLCNNLVTGEGFPEDWILVTLPGGNGGSSREICSAKCLLNLAKGRMEGDKSELRAFFVANGGTPAQIGAKTRAHVNQRHEMNGPIEDCLICRFELERS